MSEIDELMAVMGKGSLRRPDELVTLRSDGDFADYLFSIGYPLPMSLIQLAA
jgi:hypothetical protein